MTGARPYPAPCGPAHGQTSAREGKVIPIVAGRVRVIAPHHSCADLVFARAFRVEHRGGRGVTVEVDAGVLFAQSAMVDAPASVPAVALDAASTASTSGEPAPRLPTAPHPARPGPLAPRSGSSWPPPAAGGALPRHFR